MNFKKTTAFFFTMFFTTGGVVLALPVSNSKPQNLNYCYSAYEGAKACPPAICRLDCIGGINIEDCEKTCVPKPCFEIDAADCPLESCQILEGCNKQKVCYPKYQGEPFECGDLAYFGQKDCCTGLVKKCGVEFFDGSCDMVAEYSMYGVPMCIPCGDGVCGQFENACNCPEDCKRPSH